MFTHITKIQQLLPRRKHRGIYSIKFAIPQGLKNNLVTLKVYDILGKEISTIVNQNLTPGTYEADFDGSRISSGVYFYKLTAGNFTETKRMMLVK